MIIVNYLALITFTALFEYYRYTGIWDMVSIISVVAGLMVFVLSFYYAYGRTGSWKQVHIPFSKLDEREAGMAYESLRIAYAIFSVVVLLAMMAFALSGLQVGIVAFVSLLLLAHILPASVISWQE